LAPFISRGPVGLTLFFLPGRPVAVLQHGPDSEVITIDVERDVQITFIQMRPARIVKPQRVAACQDDLAHGVCITASSFKQVTQMKRAQFVLIRSDNRVVAHGDQRDTP
jgi:hypothetical protein